MPQETHALYRNGVTLITTGSEADCHRWVDTLNDLANPCGECVSWSPSSEDPGVKLALVCETLYEVHTL